MSEEFTISKDVEDLVIEAIGIALTDLSASGQLLPFVVSVANGEKTLHRCVADTFEEAEQKARNHAGVQRQAAEYVVLIFDGVVSEDSTRHEAVIAEPFEGTKAPGYRFAQLYKRSRLRKRVHPIDDIYEMGEIEN